jgi:excisionase family DNA binding protein
MEAHVRSRPPAVPNAGDRLMTIRELAAYLRLNIKTVERMARDGRLPSLRVCGRVRFRPSDIASWLAEREDRTCHGC